MIKNQNESYLNYIIKMSEKLDNDEISVTEWANAVLGDESTFYSPENLRRCSVFFRKFLRKYSDEILSSISDKTLLEQTQNAINELRKEKIKVQQATCDYRMNLREDARHDLFVEKVVGAIQDLQPLEIKNVKVTNPVGASGLLCLSDFHAGSTYTMYGVCNEIVNKYDYDIMCARMWRLIGQIESDDMLFDDLTVAFLGDFFEGILRDSSLVKLREPVVDVVIKFSEFLSNWLAELHSRLSIPIKVVVVGGNHDIVRSLGSKPQFEDENLAKLVVEFLKLRLAKCDGIRVNDYTDCAIETIRNVHIAFQHGEDKDLEDTINYFSNLYNVNISEIYCGHLHRQESKGAGIGEVGDRMCYRVGSVCGVDNFSKKCRCASRASCKMAVYTDDGHTWDRTYYMN